jgi:ribonuclease Y
MDQILDETGENVAFELGIQDLQPRLARLLGQLKYHTAQGQNLLQHCRETADLAGALAVELGVAPDIPRRAGLLHEIAQATGERLASPSILASGELVGRHAESRGVQQAIAAAHPDVTARDVEGALVRLACRLSRSRLGARKHNLEVFISRLRRLEALAAAVPGVRTAHVFRAGKELRVLVESDKISDQEAVELSRELMARIRREADTPGDIRVSVLRETRAVDYAL